MRRLTTDSLHCGSFFGSTIFTFRILRGNPKKELQWRLQVVLHLPAVVLETMMATEVAAAIAKILV